MNKDLDEQTKLRRAQWRTRRLMAWIAFWTLILIIPASFLLPQSAKEIAGILQAIAPSLMLIVAAYIGMATMDDIKRPPQ